MEKHSHSHGIRIGFLGLSQFKSFWHKLMSPLRKVFFAETSLEMLIDFQRVANL